MHRTIFTCISKSETKRKFLLWRTQIFWDWIDLSKHWRLFCYTSPPLVLNKLTPKSWVENGFPISFQTLILEKFMLYQYFKQHYMHQKLKREISNLSYQVQGSWKRNLEVFTKWKRKWVGHKHFRRQIRLHNAS